MNFQGKVAKNHQTDKTLISLPYRVINGNVKVIKLWKLGRFQ